MYIKQPKTIDELLDLLKTRGLYIEDDELAKNLLLNCTYYRLLYYLKKFPQNNDHYNCSLSEIKKYYDFDKWLRVFVFSLIGPIEVSVRSNLAQYLAENHGSDCFYNDKFFKRDPYKYQDVLDNFKLLTSDDRYLGKNPIITHHKEKYNDLYPIWVVVQFLSFANISKLFYALSNEDGNELSNSMFFSQPPRKKLHIKYLRSWLHSLSVLRNFCAHHEPLYERYYTVAPSIGNLFSYDSTKNHYLFAYFLIIRRISVPEFWDASMKNFRSYINQNDFLDLSKYGFPGDWEKYLFDRQM